MAGIAELFSAEAKELTATLEAAALSLESSPHDQERLNEVFRAAHSLKGAAAMVGLSEVAGLTHALETMLDMWRSGELQPAGVHFGGLLRAADMLREMIMLPSGSPDMPDHRALAADLEQLCHVGASGAPAPVAADDAEAADHAPEHARTIRIHFRPQADGFQYGGDPLLVFREIRTLASQMRTHLDASHLPQLAELTPQDACLAWEIELSLLPDVELDRVRDAFSFFDGLAELTIETLAQPMGSAPKAATAAAPAPVHKAPPGEPAAAHKPAAGSDVATIRVTTDKVDKVIDLMGELVIAQAVVRELVKKQGGVGNVELQEAVLLADRHLRDLQERVMSIRMVPVGAAFARVPRVVRDLAQRLGKQVRLELLGTETEMDKTLMDKLSDPLMHLVRNALDHGIEPPDQRIAAGKDGTATLQVSAYARGGNVFVEVSDDGRGLDRDRIRTKAVERGLLGADDAISDEALWKFIFHPGFSTKQEVTDVSGRGVGLDVVLRSVEELGGELQVHSTFGRGALFQLRLPLTLTILDGLLLCSGTETCVLPLTDIAFSLRIAPGQARSLAGSAEILDLRSESLPLLDLAGVLGRSRPADSDCPLAVVVQSGGYRYALRVDALLGQTQAVVKSLETHYRRVPGIMGATILGDGRVALILDGQGVAAAAGLRRGSENVRSSNERSHTPKENAWSPN
jgi:two-component system chemotaxis sensor kinase CheA